MSISRPVEVIEGGIEEPVYEASSGVLVEAVANDKRGGASQEGRGGRERG